MLDARDRPGGRVLTLRDSVRRRPVCRSGSRDLRRNPQFRSALRSGVEAGNDSGLELWKAGFAHLPGRPALPPQLRAFPQVHRAGGEGDRRSPGARVAFGRVAPAIRPGLDGRAVAQAAAHRPRRSRCCRSATAIRGTTGPRRIRRCACCATKPSPARVRRSASAAATTSFPRPWPRAWARASITVQRSSVSGRTTNR